MPDALDVCVVTVTAVALGMGFLCWAAVGNGVAGRKTDFFHPLTPKSKGFGTGAARSSTLLQAYLLSYLAVVAVVVAKWGRLRRAVREKLSHEKPTPSAPAGVTPVSSHSSGLVAASPTPSSTSVTPKTSRKRLARKRSRPSMRRSVTPEDHKLEIPSVMRSSVVRSEVIPPLPRMSMSEETEDKLNRVLKKFENMDNTSMGQESEDSLVKGKKKA